MYLNINTNPLDVSKKKKIPLSDISGYIPYPDHCEIVLNNGKKIIAQNLFCERRVLDGPAGDLYPANSLKYEIPLKTRIDSIRHQLESCHRA